MSTLFPKRKKKVSPTSNASTVEKKTILLTSVLKRITKSQKMSNSFDNFCVDVLT